jgi:hypothetical protein
LVDLVFHVPTHSPFIQQPTTADHQASINHLAYFEELRWRNTQNMPDSPPKRVTRSRAKAADTTTTKQTTVLLKPAKTPAKRKLRAEEEEIGAAQDFITSMTSKPTDIAKPVRSRSKRALTTAPSDTEDRGSQAKTSISEEKLLVAPRSTRGQARKPVVASELGSASEEQSQPKRATRARVVETSDKLDGLKRPVLAKKRVTFQVDPDKENREPNEERATKPPTPRKAIRASSATSLLKSKPIRRPAGRKSSTRATKLVQNSQESVQPLSPKKGNDNLNSIPKLQSENSIKPTSPTRSFIQSPAKRIGAVVKASPTKAQEDDLDEDPLAAGITVSPIKESIKFSFGSPAKRILSASSVAGIAASPLKLRLESVQKPPATAPVFKTSLFSSPAKRIAQTPTRSLKFTSRRPEPRTYNEADPFEIDPAQTQIPVFSFSRQVSPAKFISTKPLYTRDLSASPLKPLQSTSTAPTAPLEIVLTEPSASCDIEHEPDTGTMYEILNAMEVEEGTPTTMDSTLISVDTPLDDPATPVAFSLAPDPPRNMSGESSAMNPFAKALSGATGFWKSLASPTKFVAPGPSELSNDAFQLISPNSPCMEDSDEDESNHMQEDNISSPTLHFNRRGSVMNFVIPNRGDTVPEISSVDIKETESSDYEHQDIISMTPLVFRFGNMGLISPSKKGLGKPKRESILSPVPPAAFYGQRPDFGSDEPPAAQTSFFEEALEGMAAPLQLTPENVRLSLIPELSEDIESTQISILQEDSSYDTDDAKENDAPVNQFLLDSPIKQTMDVPAVTPKRFIVREFYTVQKVPLKPAADESPSKPILRRRGSISGPPVTQDHRTGLSRSSTVISYSPEKRASILSEDVFQNICEPLTPLKAATSTPAHQSVSRQTPSRTQPETPFNYQTSNILAGVVAYVDVHTAEGADASGVFVELLTQMGARCVKTWNWNGRAGEVSAISSPVKAFGLGGSEEGIRDPSFVGTPGGSGQGNGKPGSKVGITHVIFKDGGVRTLEKVREAGGIVSCVSAAWILE